ncbi:MAG: hypothetical protein WCH99_22335 [Verrucomicrobiota bacterium]
MNAINVVPKTVEVVPARAARSVEFTTVSWRTIDDGFSRRLQILVNNSMVIVVEGAEYDALGQWTDETIKGVILTKLGLVQET